MLYDIGNSFLDCFEEYMEKLKDYAITEDEFTFIELIYEMSNKLIAS